MKSFIARFRFGLSLGMLLLLTLAGRVQAGPSPQFPSQAHRPPSPAAVSVPVAAAPAMACPQCRSHVISEYSATSAGGKWAPHATIIGVEHDCASCTGAIATVRGHTTSTMQADCALCAHAQPACCTANG